MGHGGLAQRCGQVLDRAAPGAEGDVVVVAVFPDLVAVAHRVVGLLEEVHVHIDHAGITHGRILPPPRAAAEGEGSEFTEQSHGSYGIETKAPETVTARKGVR